MKLIVELIMILLTRTTVHGNTPIEIQVNSAIL
jgi:spore germination protein GerM